MKIKKICAIISVLTIAAMLLNPISVSAAGNTFKEGDKIQFGSYLGEKLTWTVIDIDEAGNPLIFADNLIGSKAYDVPDFNKQFTYTWHSPTETATSKLYARFEWGVSTLRDWLNSVESDASKIKYTTEVNPYESSFDSGYIPGEGGFLSAKNFSTAEASLIKEVNNKSYLIQYEQNLKESGSRYIEIPQGTWDMYDAAKYFDNAYSRTVSDKVFLLSLSEYIKAYEVMGDRVGKTDLLPTVKNMLKDNYNFTSNMEAYLLRDNYMSDDNLIPYNMIMSTQYIGDYRSIGGYTGAEGRSIELKLYGVRPACWIDSSKISSLGGLGITTYPYILNGTPYQTIKGAVNINIDGYDVKFITESGVPFIDGASRTQVPLRVTLESYGATVSWNSSTKTAIVEKNGIKVEVPVGKNYIIVNGVQQTIDTAAQNVNGRIYLPIKSVVVALGGEVVWDSVTKTVLISKDK
ncbi:stalk domain-containing protein [Sinanaerobacter chloroacetimidivorans]|uniref:Copper amine oxidase N-terminal domain-containing protein n=1 Tax=Sinanaerobacter chloroacetimidivorans TaxID=2818044 RepID=A0A8J7VXI8_9FIRM|nr:stalk domain-containing protein [Sinanaerobacter chloroacetimidivorans]MBR0596877.1 copper amine oxidase N-terminal domain-containing protein [Sinanaerobacter chloroacetimidivorans]